MEIWIDDGINVILWHRHVYTITTKYRDYLLYKPYIDTLISIDHVGTYLDGFFFYLFFRLHYICSSIEVAVNQWCRQGKFNFFFNGVCINNTQINSHCYRLQINEHVWYREGLVGACVCVRHILCAREKIINLICRCYSLRWINVDKSYLLVTNTCEVLCRLTNVPVDLYQFKQQSWITVDSHRKDTSNEFEVN